MGSEVTTELRGWLQVDSVTPYDSGNYTCVPSYAIPAWTEVHILHGEKTYIFQHTHLKILKKINTLYLGNAEENQAGLHNGASEVKVDVTSSSSPLRSPHHHQSLIMTAVSLIAFAANPLKRLLLRLENRRRNFLANNNT